MKQTAQPRVINTQELRVLVTAGGSGIGRSIAESFANTGAQVHISDVVEPVLVATLDSNSGITGTLGDASCIADVDRVVADATAQMGGLDVLINNAGIAGPTGEIDSISDEDVAQTLDINLKSQFHFIQRLTPILKQSTRNPSIISISSVAGRLGYGYRTPYAASKWAIVGLIKSLAIELGPLGVRANAILPGPVNGERMDRVIADRAASLGATVEETRNEYVQNISLRRMVDPIDVANMALFLASDLAHNITGQVISVDGNAEKI